MAREEELKRVDLKVNVSCCEGCRRMVMKAMSLKGVLRTEIHPSLDRVTVVGDVDSKVLVKKLGKIGKIAEVVVSASAPPEGQRRREDNGGGRKESDAGGDKPAPADEKIKRKDKGEKAPAPPAATSSSKQECSKCAHHGPAPAPARAAADDDTDQGNGKTASSKYADTSKSGEEGGAGDDDFVGANATSFAVDHAAATYHQHYHRAEPAMVVPVHVPYYAANPAPYYAGYYAMPAAAAMPLPLPQRPPQLRPQPSRFDEDFFNDDNTVGCRVM